jgi:hypothetical protein
MIDLILNDYSHACGEGYETAMDEGAYLGAVYESALPHLNGRVEK